MGQMSFQLWKGPMYGQPTVMLSFPRPSCWAKTPLRLSSEVIAWVPLRPHPLMSTFVDRPADGCSGNGRCDASKKCASPNLRSKETAGVESILVAAAAVDVGVGEGSRVFTYGILALGPYSTCPRFAPPCSLASQPAWVRGGGDKSKDHFLLYRTTKAHRLKKFRPAWQNALVLGLCGGGSRLAKH